MRKSLGFLVALAGLVLVLTLPVFAQATAAPAPAAPFQAFLAMASATAPAWVPLVNTFIVPPLTAWAKGLPIPFTGATAAGIIVALGAFSTLTTVVCNFLIAWLSGNLAAFDFANAGVLLGQVVTSVLTAAGGFGLWQKWQKASN